MSFSYKNKEHQLGKDTKKSFTQQKVKFKCKSPGDAGAPILTPLRLSLDGSLGISTRSEERRCWVFSRLEPPAAPDSAEAELNGLVGVTRDAMHSGLWVCDEPKENEQNIHK